MPQLQTVLETIENNFLTGQVFIQWRKQIVADNGAVVFAEPHRTSLEPQHYATDNTGAAVMTADGTPDLIQATDLTGQLDAVDAHLIALGWPAMSAEDRATIANYDSQRTAVVAALPTGVSSVL